MTIEKWLADVHYDNLGTCIWNREKDGGNQMIADIRGWGAIQNEFKTNEEAEKFQDEVGEFIVQAIKEKLASTSSQTEISDTTITDQIDGIIFELPFDDKIKLWELIDELIEENITKISDEEIFYQKQVMNPYSSNEHSYTAVEVPKEIWDADMSIWNVLFGRRDIMGAWMKSIVSVVNQIKH